MELQELYESLKSVKDEMVPALQKQDEEIKKHGGTLTETSKLVKSLEEQIEKIHEGIEEQKARGETLDTRLVDLEKKAGRPDLGAATPEEVKSLGSLLVESEQFKRMKANGQFTSDPVHLKSLWAMERKALDSTDESAGALIEPFRRPGVLGLAQRRLRIRDLLPAQPISTNEVEYVEETGFTNNAAFVAENPDNAKPESDLTYDLKTAQVRTIAHWIRASRQVLDDAPQLRARVDNQLLYGLDFVIENQILYGNGVGNNLQGIMTHADVQTYDIASGPATDTRIDAIRRAMTLVDVAFYEATGVVVNPFDWEDIELAKDNENRYIWIVVTEGGIQRLFRLPVVVTPAINRGEALVGAFNLGAMLWDREQASIRISEHHSDFFVKNMVAVLAEARLALTIDRPESFVNVTVGAGS